MKIHLKLIALLFALLANFPTPAMATSPQGRHVTGTIKRVDGQTHEVEMLREDKGTLRHVEVTRTHGPNPGVVSCETYVIDPT